MGSAAGRDGSVAERMSMPTPEMSEELTEGIRVGASAFYLPQESDPDERRYAFAYTIVIANEGDRAAKLLSRHWVIIDAQGRREEVRGPGVVGETPRLEPGQAFKYQSLCPLRTPWGTMEGSYTMRRDDGGTFEALVARFFLRVPAREPVGGP